MSDDDEQTLVDASFLSNEGSEKDFSAAHEESVIQDDRSFSFGGSSAPNAKTIRDYIDGGPSSQNTIMPLVKSPKISIEVSNFTLIYYRSDLMLVLRLYKHIVFRR